MYGKKESDLAHSLKQLMVQEEMITGALISKTEWDCGKVGAQIHLPTSMTQTCIKQWIKILLNNLYSRVGK